MLTIMKKETPPTIKLEVDSTSNDQNTGKPASNSDFTGNSEPTVKPPNPKKLAIDRQIDDEWNVKHDCRLRRNELPLKFQAGQFETLRKTHLYFEKAKIVKNSAGEEIEVHNDLKNSALPGVYMLKCTQCDLFSLNKANQCLAIAVFNWKKEFFRCKEKNNILWRHYEKAHPDFVSTNPFDYFKPTIVEASDVDSKVSDEKRMKSVKSLYLKWEGRLQPLITRYGFTSNVIKPGFKFSDVDKSHHTSKHVGERKMNFIHNNIEIKESILGADYDEIELMKLSSSDMGVYQIRCKFCEFFILGSTVTTFCQAVEKHDRTWRDNVRAFIRDPIKFAKYPTVPKTLQHIKDFHSDIPLIEKQHIFAYYQVIPLAKPETNDNSTTLQGNVADLMCEWTLKLDKPRFVHRKLSTYAWLKMNLVEVAETRKINQNDRTVVSKRRLIINPKKRGICRTSNNPEPENNRKVYPIFENFKTKRKEIAESNNDIESKAKLRKLDHLTQQQRHLPYNERYKILYNRRNRPPWEVAVAKNFTCISKLPNYHRFPAENKTKTFDANLPGIYLIKCRTTGLYIIKYTKSSLARHFTDQVQIYGRGGKRFWKTGWSWMIEHAKKHSIEITAEPMDFFELFDVFILENYIETDEDENIAKGLTPDYFMKRHDVWKKILNLSWCDNEE